MFTLKEILIVTSGTLKNIPKTEPVSVKGVCTDSRHLKPGDLFIAIQGPNFDGHNFVQEAAKKSASVIIVSRNIKVSDRNVAVVRVMDTVKALGQIARFHRDRFAIPVIAITGSTGKTTTKEMTAAVLGRRYNVLKNIATENNHIGVPKALLNLTSKHDVAVIELGTNHFGEIRWLTEVANPTITLFTNIGESHLESFKSPAGVFKEKSNLAKYMRAPGTVIYNADDRHLPKIARCRRIKRFIDFGINNTCDYRADRIRLREDFSLEFRVNRRKRFTLSSPAVHNVYNALAAISCGCLLKVSLNDCRDAIARFNFPKGRQTLEKIGSRWLIDDTYNANPVSFRSAIETLRKLEIPGRKILVCGDMFELGSQAKKLHCLVGKMAADSDLDFVVTVGKNSKLVSDYAKRSDNCIQAYHEGSLASAFNRLKNYVQPGDAILVKGSRGMHMEEMVEFLKALKD
ncbi:MAG TPA: UDP-N-acetylmuramoyl-tripeptide--D-alanyl-D-alanine ligase [Candidatus Omnitrophota bacterium]|nr:UDP-N-acetylmuramoyl-tripeptide--D-alanyl-D-alanine ligase [Candidatus Omnitrophota bacterium]HPD85100.1 UDP-N-acetylmuramoyl-tripeptide--D-alanyl-D-alanine ligase [Candidatus Omnitrophota bacterium]HRZ03958.1 UDP-N-acetylmuramoyl-tripeptide--D-alanyl-D-alanine ligase [Candidatus Omnitrophota bacterium]